MKLRLAAPHLPAFLHRSSHARQHRRSHEGVLRVFQLILMVVIALFCAKLIANGAVFALRALSGFIS